VTVRLNAWPALTLPGAESCSLLAAAGLTTMPLALPVVPANAVFDAVIDCVPAVTSVALKRCTPWSPALNV
jgi:hypothetical protein